MLLTMQVTLIWHLVIIGMNGGIAVELDASTTANGESRTVRCSFAMGDSEDFDSLELWAESGRLVAFMRKNPYPSFGFLLTNAFINRAQLSGSRQDGFMQLRLRAVCEDGQTYSCKLHNNATSSVKEQSVKVVVSGCDGETRTLALAGGLIVAFLLMIILSAVAAVKLRRMRKRSAQQEHNTTVAAGIEHRDYTSNDHLHQNTRNVEGTCRNGEPVALVTVPSTDFGRPVAANPDESEHQYATIQNEQQQCANISTEQPCVGGVADNARIVARTSLATPPIDNGRDEAGYDRLRERNIEHSTYTRLRPAQNTSAAKTGDAERTASSNSETTPPKETEIRYESLGEQSVEHSVYTDLRILPKDDTKTDDAEQSILSDSLTPEQLEYEKLGERLKAHTYTALSSAAKIGKRMSPDYQNEKLPFIDKDVSAEPDYQNEHPSPSTQDSYREVTNTNAPSSQPTFANVAKFAIPGNLKEVDFDCFLTSPDYNEGAAVLSTADRLQHSHEDEKKHAGLLTRRSQIPDGSKTRLAHPTMTDDADDRGKEQTTENQYEKLQHASEDDFNTYTRLRGEKTTTNNLTDYTDARSPSSFLHSV